MQQLLNRLLRMGVNEKHTVYFIKRFLKKKINFLHLTLIVETVKTVCTKQNVD